MITDFNFYYILDGNFPTLSAKEYNLLLKLFSGSYFKSEKKIIDEIRIANLKGEYLEIVKSLQKYSKFITLTKNIGFVLHEIELERRFDFEILLKKIIGQVKNSKYKLKIPETSSFKIDVLKKGEFDKDFKITPKLREKLKYDLAYAYMDKFNFKVNLKNPDILIQVIITTNKIILGILLVDVNRKKIINRSPANRSFFHPASMSPLLVRTMVNLSLTPSKIPFIDEIRNDGKIIFLDPFMGGAGMLMEAYEQGYKTIGLELGFWECRGARMNLINYNDLGGEDWSIIRVNSKKIPLKSNSVDVIVTDPPYGQSTMLGGMVIEDLITYVLKECYRILKPGSKMVISIPKSIEVNLGKFIILDKIENRVHRSLTRIIFILEKHDQNSLQ